MELAEGVVVTHLVARQVELLQAEGLAGTEEDVGEISRDHLREAFQNIISKGNKVGKPPVANRSCFLIVF